LRELLLFDRSIFYWKKVIKYYENDPQLISTLAKRNYQKAVIMAELLGKMQGDLTPEFLHQNPELLTEFNNTIQWYEMAESFENNHSTLLGLYELTGAHKKRELLLFKIK